MTLNALMTRAADVCIDERERYLIIFTEGANGYVCRNESLIDESQALFHGTYRDCQIWVERRGIAAAIRQVLRYLPETPELTNPDLSIPGVLELLSRGPD